MDISSLSPAIIDKMGLSVALDAKVYVLLKVDCRS